MRDAHKIRHSLQTGLSRIRPVAPERTHLLLQDVKGSLASFGSGARHRIFTYRILDQMVQGRELAHGIRGASIACQEKSLAAASAKIYLAAVTRAAGLRHPVFAAKFLERLGALPDPIERVLAHIVKAHARNHARRMTRQRAAGGID